MMSADDEPQTRQNSDTKPISSINPQNTNSLINEAFNINNSIGNIQPLMVLPPSSNHFQPIHSRTPSAEVKDISANMFKHSPQIPLMQSFPNLTPTNNSASFFDQKNVSPLTNTLAPTMPQPNVANNTNNLSVENKIQNTSIPTLPIHAPIPTKPPVQFLTSNPISLTTPNSQFASNVPPPSTLPPPVSMPPPTNLNTGTAGANPYAAKGALNKKVYDTGIPTVALTPPSSISNAIPNSVPKPLEVESKLNNFSIAPPLNTAHVPLMTPSFIPNSAPSNQYMTPLVPPTHQTIENSSFPTNIPQSSTSYQIQNPGQPLINLNERFTASLNVDNNNATTNDAQNKTMWNWFTKNKLVNTFVEKVITTVDPQMKEFIHPANQPFLLVTSHGNLAHTIRESFANAGFSKITLNILDAQNTSQFAPQVVGFQCALQSAKEKLDSSLAYMQQAECVCLAFQDFLVELTPDCWFEMAVILLKDKINNIDLTLYTEAIPIPLEDINQIQQFTPNDYPLKWSGFSVRLPEKNFNFNTNGTVISYETSETAISQTRISHAIKTLALTFKNKLLAKIQS